MVIIHIDARVSFVTNEDTSDGLLTTALLVGNFKAAVDICISNNQMVHLIMSCDKSCDLSCN